MVQNSLRWLFVVICFSGVSFSVAAKKNAAKKAYVQKKRVATKKEKTLARRVFKKKTAQHKVQRVHDCQVLPIDIPVPLGTRLCKGGIQSNLSGAAGLPIKMRYTSTQSASAVVAFYETEMERLGWQKMASYRFDQESMLLFDKPDRIVLVCLYGSKKRPEMTITVGSKEPAVLL